MNDKLASNGFPDAGPEWTTSLISRYNVVWNAPSKDPSGVMPIGNGNIAAGVYAIENGDLYLLLSKNDALTYCGDLFKTGRVRISLAPNPFVTGSPYRQTLDLSRGIIEIVAGEVMIRIWCSIDKPIYYVDIEAQSQIQVRVEPEFWERIDHCIHNDEGLPASTTINPAQQSKVEQGNKIAWYFSVGDYSIFQDDLKYYEIEHLAETHPDPFRYNVFGNLLTGPSLDLRDGALHGEGTHLRLRIDALTLQTPDCDRWIEAISQQSSAELDAGTEWENNQAWWDAFWRRSWIVVSDNTIPPDAREVLRGDPTAAGARDELDGGALVAQSYSVFRFLMACQSRGRIQTKFNGGLFTQQLHVEQDLDRYSHQMLYNVDDGSRLTHEDERLWGRRFTFQNQRLMYWPLLAGGDFDLMRPFFSYYSDLLPIRKAITKAWFGHEGAYYRENIEMTGAERDCGDGGHPRKAAPGAAAEFYHDYYFTCGLETVAMMLEYVRFTDDLEFSGRVLIPFAREILLFFDKHYSNLDGQVLRIDPGMVLETWWLAVNPAPDIAGLRYCIDELLDMRAGTESDREAWTALRKRLPEVPTHFIDGRRAIAPAERWDLRNNAENGEMYPAFPFACFGLALGSRDIVEWTMQHRSSKDAFLNDACWSQNEIGWALAGNADEAASGLERRFRRASKSCRFPLYGDAGPDSCPDFDHFGSGSIALQKMIVQEAGDNIHLLPAWPARWDLKFKLHLRRGTVISGEVKEGKLISFEVDPPSRQVDVIIHNCSA